MGITLVINSTLKDGVTQDWRNHATNATAFSRNEEGTTGYSWYLNPDGQAVNVQVFTDEASMFAHIGGFTEAGLIEAWMSIVDIQSINVLGSVSDEGKEALTAFGPTYFEMAAGF